MWAVVIKFGSQIMLVVAISGVGAGFLGLYAVHIMINLLALFADRVTSYPFEFRPDGFDSTWPLQEQNKDPSMYQGL